MKTYLPRNIEPVEAVQWDGSRHQAQEIMSWIEEVGCRAEYVAFGPGWPDRIQFSSGEGLEVVEPQAWVVRQTVQNPHDSELTWVVFEVLTEYDFEQRYRE